LVLDFSSVAYIDSSGLATLVEYVRDAQAFKGKLSLASPAPRVKTVLELVRLDKILNVQPSVEAALGALR
jgi:anti-sigma B factor antagonist